MAERLPKYERLRRLLLDDVEQRAPHAPLPPERNLADQYQVSRATLRQALAELEKSGAVYRVQGAGTFVAEPVISKSVTLTSFSEDMADRGLRPSSRVLVADRMPVAGRIGEELGLDARQEVVRLVRVRLADDEPMCLEMTYLPAAMVPGLLDRDVEGPLYALMAEYGIRPIVAEQKVEAAVVAESEAALLGVVAGSAVLRVRRLARDQRGRAVEYTTSLYRADRYDIRFTVRRRDA